MVLSNENCSWFALRVKPQTEHRVSAMLKIKGYDEFLPTSKVHRRGAIAHVPLFPGYVFCKFNSNAQGLMVTTPGVICIVSFGGRPAPIDPAEIYSIQVVVRSGTQIRSCEGLCVGDKVRVEDGPLRGVIGVLASFDRKKRILVSVTMMMRTVMAEVEPEWLSVISPCPMDRKKVEPATYSPLMSYGS